MWGAFTVPVGHDYGHVGHDSIRAQFLPHIPAESRPTSQRNPAPLQTESVPHFDRNTQHASGAWKLWLTVRTLTDDRAFGADDVEGRLVSRRKHQKTTNSVGR